MGKDSTMPPLHVGLLDGINVIAIHPMTPQQNNNIVNDGIACSHCGMIAYNKRNTIVVKRNDGTVVILPYDGYFLNATDTHLYYALKTDNFSLYRYDFSTQNNEKLLHAEMRWIQLVQGVLYYTCNEENFLYAFDTKSLSATLLLKQSCNYLSVIDSTIYFSNWSRHQELWKYDTISKSADKVLDKDVAWINVVNDTSLVFRSWHNRKTYFLNLETNTIRCLNTDGANYLCYYEGYIYYYNSRLHGIWRQSISDKNDKSYLHKGFAKRINVVDGVIFFQNRDKQLASIQLSQLKPYPLLDYIEMIVTTICNKQCVNCSNGIPYILHPQHVRYKDFCHDLDDLLALVSCIQKFQIHGGEPLLNPDLPSMVEYTVRQQKILKIRIATNGTITPNPELIKILSESRAELSITSYPDNEAARKALIQLCVDNNILYTLHPEQEWFAFDGSHGLNSFQTCQINHYPCYFEGNIYLCARICHLYRHLDRGDCIQVNSFEGDLTMAMQNIAMQTPCKRCNITSRKINPGT
ncbi:MAG: DUF5050 domain-containing protein [Bacteroides sp.]|nr:DUF5050 domain-containing protein [Bacteroides sp.]